jgi:hypothetical protein
VGSRKLVEGVRLMVSPRMSKMLLGESHKIFTIQPSDISIRMVQQTLTAQFFKIVQFSNDPVDVSNTIGVGIQE